MTRSSFLDDVTCWDDLRVFCDNEGCSYLDDFYTDESRDEYINEMIDDLRNEGESWLDIRDFLNARDREGFHDNWIREYGGDWVGLEDGDFEEYKRSVLEWADGEGIFEEEYEPDEDEDEYENEWYEPEEDPVEQEDCSISDMLHCGYSVIRAHNDETERLAKEAEREAEEENRGFSVLINVERYSIESDAV